VSGNVITITGGEGFTRTIDVSSATTYSEGGSATTLSSVIVGSKISADGIVSADQTALDALVITIAAPKAVVLTGNVTAVTSTSVSVEGSNNSSTTFTIAPTTTFFEGGKAVTSSALVVGERVVVTTSSASPTTASKISIKLATLTGTVTSVSGNVITITGGEGFTRTIDVSSATTYSEGGSATTLSSVIVGSKISADGIVSADQTALDALVITIAAPKAVVLTGTVTSVSGNVITITGGEGFTRTIDVSSATTYSEGGSATTLSSVIVGSKISADGIVSADQTALDALVITIAAPKAV
jgi:hypothetical protein